MSRVQDQTPQSIEVTNVEDEQLVIDWIYSAKTTQPSSSTASIPKVPKTLIRETSGYEKYYVPKVVSIGPYHFGDEKLELGEKLKSDFTMKLMKLLSDNKLKILSLYEKLGEMVQELRNFYEENLIAKFSNRDFTKMMLLDCCFILYYIKLISGEKVEDSCSELNRPQIVFIHQDLFLLENQIPFKVLMEVTKLVNIDGVNMFKKFVRGNILASEEPKRKWFTNKLGIGSNQSSRDKQNLELIDVDHLLHLLHRTLTKNNNVQDDWSKQDRCTFRNVNELMDVGIHFKPSETMSLAHIEYLKGWWWFKANVELPPITVDDSTKPMLLNLIAYETCTCASSAWVTSYVCLLDSLIDHPGDVKTLRKAGVLENALGSDEEVTKLFNEIGTDLVPNSLAFMEAKSQIQDHYKSYSNTLISQLKHEYVKSPWAFLALLGALIALGLSVVQTYYSVWSPKSDCDDLCKFLKINHHL